MGSLSLTPAINAWPKIIILHPLQGSPDLPNYAPYSSKVVGWCLAPEGIERVDIFVLGKLVNTIRRFEACAHETAIAEGGVYYKENCGFSIILPMAPDGEPSDSVSFEFCAVSNSGKVKRHEVRFRVDANQSFRRLRKITEGRALAARQRLVVDLLKRYSESRIVYASSAADGSDAAKALEQHLSGFPPTIGRNIRWGSSLVPPCFKHGNWDAEIVDGALLVNRALRVGEMPTFLAETNLILEAVASVRYTGETTAANQFLETLVYKNQSINAHGPLLDKDQVRSVLVIKLDNLGDIVSALPALRSLKEILPRAKLSILSSPYTASVIHNLDCVDEVFTLESLPRRRWDIAVDLRVDEDTRHVLSAVDAFLKFSFGDLSDDPFHVVVPGMLPRIAPVGWGHGRHIAEQLSSLVACIDIHLRVAKASPSRVRIGMRASSAHQELDASTKNDPGPGYMIVNVGPPNDTRCWSAVNFAKLADMIHRKAGFEIVVIGSEAERARCEEVMASLLGSGITPRSYIGLTDTAKLLDLVGNADFFIGIDSGPKHIAAEFGVPGIIIHGGRHSPVVWGSTFTGLINIYSPVICSPCLINKASDCPNGLVCLENISVDFAFYYALMIRDLYC